MDFLAEYKFEVEGGPGAGNGADDHLSLVVPTGPSPASEQDKGD